MEKNKIPKKYVRLERGNINICQEVTEEVYNKIKGYLDNQLTII